MTSTKPTSSSILGRLGRFFSLEIDGVAMLLVKRGVAAVLSSTVAYCSGREDADEGVRLCLLGPLDEGQGRSTTP